MATINQNLKLMLIAGALTGLAACSSNPSSPWGQGGSPWEARSQDVAEQPVEEAPVAAEPIEAIPAETPMAEPEPVVDYGEPGTPMEDPVAATEETEPSYIAEEPAAEPIAADSGTMIEPEATSTQAGDIASLPAEQFAVQVVASSSMENLLAFASAHNIADDWTAKTMIGDKVWYILLSGVYASKAEAQAALDEVAAQLDTAPWIRNVGSIQEIMAP